MGRSTVRLDDDVLRELKSRAQREKTSLTRALNRVLRAGLHAPEPARRQRYREKVFSLGAPRIDLTKALAIAASLDDEETARKASLRK